MTAMTPSSPRRVLALAGLAIAILLLVPGLILPVITIRGVLQPAGVADLAPKLLNQGISDQSIAALKPLINPMVLPLLEASPGGLKGALVTRLGAQLAAELKKGADIEVYQQTRSILGSVRHLYRVGSFTAATLILLFSVLVPFVKGALVMWAVVHRDALRRERTLRVVEIIAKWSMADVFAVALFIAYLAAQASQTAGSSATAAVAFTATFGPGFYWFAAYCVFSLGVQQATTRWIMAARTAP
jgi:uncharacterized paraquat-inducible protein A